jgi:outer membrane protein assembly factor BamB
MSGYFYRNAVLLSLAALLTGCSLFGKEKLNIDGERINVITENVDLSPDYDIEKYKLRLPEPYENNKWDQSGGNSMHLMGHLKAADTLDKIWDKSFGKGSSKRDFLLSTPIIAHKVVFNIDSQGLLTARLLENGKQIWEKRLKPANRDDKSSAMKGAGLAEYNKKIYATTGFGNVFCLDMTTGDIIWNKEIGLPIRIAPTVNENKVFVQTIDNMLVALDAIDGSELWKYKTDYDGTTLVGGAAPAYNPDLDVLIAAFSNG